MTSSQSFIEQAAEESFKGLNAFGPKEYIHQINIFYKAGFVSGVAWRDEHIKELVEAAQQIESEFKSLKRADGDWDKGYKVGVGFAYQMLKQALSAFKETPSRVGKE